MSASDAPPCYAVRSLVKSYPGADRPANDGIDLDVPAGRVLGLLGPNGAGKSTLVRQLIGLLRPDRGTVELFGMPVAGRPELSSRYVAYLAQDEPALAELPVGTAIETTARLRGLGARRARAERDDLLAELGLAAVATKPLTALSGGQRRLAAVGTALAGDRPVLVLDEPTTGLDPVARRAVWGALRRRQAAGGATVVLVTHDVREAESVVDRVAVLRRGRVVACDTPGGLKALAGDDVRLDVVWRTDPPPGDPTVAMLARRASVTGRRWSARLTPAEARAALERLSTGPALTAMDDFSLTTPSLEDVYLALGEPAGLERA
ncbi:MAG: ABC transporter ATP-binding protein [Frankiaceae bacterium]